MAITTSNCKQDGDVESESRIDDLNDTLLELIFTRLSPWKSLVISKCVSKRWNSIISNPDFTRQLTSQSLPFTLFDRRKKKGGECLVTEHPYFQKHKFPLDFIPTSDVILANTNDDLIVVYHSKNIQEGKYYVANPLTKQYVVVPIRLAKPIEKLKYYTVGIAGFVDGVSTVVNVSHHNNHGFRIVQIVGSRNRKSTVQVYSSKTEQWKTYLFDHFDCPLSRYRQPRQAITWKNKIHWKEGSKIVVIDPFNIDNVAPQLINLPNEIGNRSRVIGVCQNQLRIAQFEQSGSRTRIIKIWEVIDYDDVGDDLGTNYLAAKVKLVNYFKLNISTILEQIFPGAIRCRYYPVAWQYSCKIVCCHPNDPQVVYFCNFCCDTRLFYYNVVDQKCKLMDCRRHGISSFVFVHPP